MKIVHENNKILVTNSDARVLDSNSHIILKTKAESVLSDLRPLGPSPKKPLTSFLIKIEPKPIYLFLLKCMKFNYQSNVN